MNNSIKKTILFSAMFLYSVGTIKAQYNKSQPIAECYSFFIDSILKKETTHANIILNELENIKDLNRVLGDRKNYFWDKMKDIQKSNDTSVLFKAYSDAISFKRNQKEIFPSKKAIKGVQFIDNIIDSSYNILKNIELKVNAAIVSISKPMFSKNNEYCILFYHKLDGGGNIIFLKRSSNKWICDEKEALWIE